MTYHKIFFAQSNLLRFFILGIVLVYGGDLRAQERGSDTLQVDTREAFYRLIEEGTELEGVMAEVQKGADFYDPPVLYAMAGRLFQKGEKEKAVFWFYLAQVRSLFSVNLAKDVLREFGEKKMHLYAEYFGTSIEAYALSHETVLYPILGKIDVYLEDHKENYNLLWPYTDEEGVNAPSKTHFFPKETWGDIREETLTQFKKKWQGVKP